jgi:glucosyl-dolichyl phosphate glucuronosyltransferase
MAIPQGAAPRARARKVPIGVALEQSSGKPETRGQAPPLRDVTIAIATCDDDPNVLERLLSAVSSEPVQQPAIVVDMSRGAAVRDVATGQIPGVNYVPFPESSGLSESRNRLIELASTRYLLFIDADAVPRPGWAIGLRKAFDLDDGIAVAGARCLPAWPRKPPALFQTQPALDMLGMFDLGTERREVPRVIGTSFALDRERLPPGPPFSAKVGRRPGTLLGGEEVDLSVRVKVAGWRISYEPASVVDHHVRPERLSWSWMFKRMYAAGQESVRWSERLEDLPRKSNLRDLLFLALVSPCFLAGRLKGERA